MTIIRRFVDINPIDYQHITQGLKAVRREVVADQLFRHRHCCKACKSRHQRSHVVQKPKAHDHNSAYSLDPRLIIS